MTYTFNDEDYSVLLEAIQTAADAHELYSAAILSPYELAFPGSYQGAVEIGTLTIDAEQWDSIYQAMCDRSAAMDPDGGLHLLFVMEWGQFGPGRAT